MNKKNNDVNKKKFQLLFYFFFGVYLTADGFQKLNNQESGLFTYLIIVGGLGLIGSSFYYYIKSKKAK